MDVVDDGKEGGGDGGYWSAHAGDIDAIPNGVPSS